MQERFGRTAERALHNPMVDRSPRVLQITFSSVCDFDHPHRELQCVGTVGRFPICPSCVPNDNRCIDHFGHCRVVNL